MNKNKLRTAADWWQMLEESQVRTLVSKYYSDKAEPELSAQNVLKIYEAENPTPDSKEGLHTQKNRDLENLVAELRKSNLRQFTCLNDWGYSQSERNIVDAITAPYKNERKALLDALEDVAKWYAVKGQYNHDGEMNLINKNILSILNNAKNI